MNAVQRFFGVRAAGSTLGVEVRAGLTTFVTMAYILFVNPAILGDAIPVGAPQLLTATALAAALGSLMMGVVARYPFALAPGMGLNAYFAYTVVGEQGVAWTTALGAVFLSGVLFLVLSVTGVRTALVEAIPPALRRATAAGIGLFLAFIGLRNAGIVVDSPATLVTLGAVGAAGPVLGLGGLILTAGLMARQVPAAILLGIAATTSAAIVFGAPVYGGAPFAGFVDGIVALPAWPGDLLGALDVGAAFEMGALGIVFVFCFVDLFDTAGTLTGLAERVGAVTEDGALPRSDRAFAADAVATVAGAVMGTSTTTSYIESASGVEAGGRTGLTAVVVALCFVLSLFAWPLVGVVPAVATAPALIIAGGLMMASAGGIEWSDVCRAVPAFLTIALMPLTFSIANGIAAGIVAVAVIHPLAGRHREVTPALYVVAAIIVARYGWLAAG